MRMDEIHIQGCNCWVVVLLCREAWAAFEVRRNYAYCTYKASLVLLWCGFPYVKVEVERRRFLLLFNKTVNYSICFLKNPIAFISSTHFDDVSLHAKQST